MQCARHDRQSQLALVRDVVGVRVRAQDMRRRHAPLPCFRDQRLDGGAAVDEDGRSTRLVRDEVGVGQPARIHAALDEHWR